MKRSVALAILAVLLTGLLLLGFADTTSIADSSIPEDEATSSVSKARNSSASATIMITWTPASDEGD
ncbi:MAG TPA: hypothetical protein VMV76_00030 [Dehalococcoidia bacterium]|nr:hypothetical protein [Dehalococcoidia bacterium]